MHCAWSPDGALVSAGSADRFVYIWDTITRKIVYKLPGHLGSVNDVDFHKVEPIGKYHKGCFEDFSFRNEQVNFDKLLIKNPLGGMNYMAYIEPLHYTAWYAIGLFFIVTPPFLYLTTR